MDKYNWETSLPTKWAGRKIVYQDEMVSTNRTVAELGNAGAPHGTLAAADKQTGGRGRRGRTWESPVGKNLYFSLLLRPDIPTEKVSMLTLVMAHSVAKAIERIADIKVGIKWPNDILIHGKKVCGILTEMKMDGSRIDHVVIGVGVNVHSQKFDGELADKASSLEEACKASVDRGTLLKYIMQAFEEDYEAFAACGDLVPFMEYYHSRLLNRNAQVRVLDPQSPFEGTAGGITPMGELIVEKADGQTCLVYAGEVSVRGLQGYV